jgi:putative Holliday junction resolvase
MSRAMGIDYGSVRIGTAVSDELRMLAHPLETIPAGKDAIHRIVALANEKQVDAIVVGVPRNMSGESGVAADEANEFIAKLRGRVKCKVVAWDERLTTVAANRALQDAGKKTRETRGYVDQVAAQMILQGFLDQEQLRKEILESGE